MSEHGEAARSERRVGEAIDRGCWLSPNGWGGSPKTHVERWKAREPSNIVGHPTAWEVHKDAAAGTRLGRSFASTGLMLPTRSRVRAFRLMHSEPVLKRSTESVAEAEEEVTATSVGPVATNILQAVMSIRRDAKERELEPEAGDAVASSPPPSAIHERSVCWDGEGATLVGAIEEAESRRPRGTVSSEIPDVILPSDDVFEEWLDALQDGAPNRGLPHSQTKPCHASSSSDVTLEPFVATAMNSGSLDGVDHHKDTLVMVMPRRPADPSLLVMQTPNIDSVDRATLIRYARAGALVGFVIALAMTMAMR